jgi:hypothetical protein
LTNKRMQDDLDRHVSEKFETWFKDSLDTYKRAGCEYEKSMSHVAYLTLLGAVTIMLAVGVNNKTMHEALDTIIKRANEDYDECITGKVSAIIEELKKRGMA